MEIRQILQQKEELQAKIDHETYNLSILKESLAKSDLVTNNMVSILGSFEDRLLRLEETILPVYEETRNLQRRQHNIENTLGALNHVMNFYGVAKEVEPVIRTGPTDQLDQYLRSMDKLKTALHYFNENNPGSVELSTVISLQETGREGLERDFRMLLNRHSKPVSHVLILDLLGLDEELPTEDFGIDVHMPEQVVSDLGKISEWLVHNTDNLDFLNAYATVRADVMNKSIIGLKEHQKTSSGSSRTFQVASPALGGKMKSVEKTPTKRPSKRGYMYKDFVKKASQSLSKHSLYSLGEPGRAKPGVTEEEFQDIDVQAFVLMMSAFVKLSQSEIMLLTRIIPEEHHSFVFDKVVTKSLDAVVEEGESIINSIKKLVTKQRYIAMLNIFPILERYRSLRTEFDLTLEGCRAPTREKIYSLRNSFESLVVHSMDEFLENFRSESEKQARLPKDGTVHEVTSNTMFYLGHLWDMDYGDIAGNVIAAQDPNYRMTSSNPQSNKNALAAFFNRTLSALGLNLETKAETYGDSSIKALFLLNNYNYILRSLQKSGLISIIQLYNPDVEIQYNVLIKQHRRQYMQSWNRLLQVLQDARTVSLPYKPTDKLKDKDRQLIKDKFNAFNKEVEDLTRIQKGYAIPDPDLRDDIRTENKDLIIPKYKSFLDKYANYQFTKNPEKYKKYTIEQIKQQLDSFFDTAA